MYARVHKLHHAWKAPVSWVTFYAHPFEHCLINIIPFVVPLLVCQSDWATVTMLSVIGMLHTMLVHSGYWICDDGGMHDEHHLRFNVNYGSMGIMDRLYGTYRLPNNAASLA